MSNATTGPDYTRYIDHTKIVLVRTHAADHFDACLKAARADAALEADTDAEISLEHGLELTEELAAELLDMSTIYTEIVDAEIREAYRAAYLSRISEYEIEG